MLDAIAFDADDTLWHNMQLFASTENRFKDLLAGYHEPSWIEKRLFETEMRNLEVFGYGIKGFTLSMIETAIDLSEGRISGREIQAILDLGRSMLAHPIELFDHAEETVRLLSASHELILITKGDLFDQESKLARSGLGDCFHHVEIVSRKDEETYRTILGKHSIHPDRFLMVGDSLKSDILPVVALGAQAVHVPFEITWAHEEVPSDLLSRLYFHTIDHLGELPKIVSLIEGQLPAPEVV